MPPTCNIHASYGSNICFAPVAATKLFRLIPYIHSHLRFNYLRKESIDNFMTDDIFLDLKTVSVTLPNKPLSVGVWAFFFEYVTCGLIPMREFVVENSSGQIVEKFKFKDDNLIEITDYAQYMGMDYFLDRLCSIIMAVPTPAFYNLLVCDTEESVTRALEYFSFLVCSLHGTHVGIIDALASTLATRKVWQWSHLLGQLKEAHITRFVKRTVSFFGPARNVFDVVKVWCSETNCDASLAVKLLLSISTDCDELEKDIEDEVVKTIAKNSRINLQDILSPVLRDVILQYEARERMKVFKDNYTVEREQTRRYHSCEIYLHGSVLRVTNKITRNSSVYNMYLTPHTCLIRENKGYDYDLVVSNDYQWLFHVNVSDATVCLVKMNLGGDVFYQTSNIIAWQYVSAISHIFRPHVAPRITQIINRHTFIFVNDGYSSLIVFHKDGPWVVTRDNITSCVNNFSVKDVVPQTDHLLYRYSYCMVTENHNTIIVYAISEARRKRMYKTVVEVKSWDKLLVEQSSPFGSVTRTQLEYPDINPDVVLPSLFTVKSGDLVCLSNLFLRGEKIDKVTSVFSLYIDCSVYEGDQWSVRPLKSKPFQVHNDTLLVNELFKIASIPSKEMNVQMKGHVVGDDHQSIVLYDGDRHKPITKLFSLVDVEIDLNDNTVCMGNSDQYTGMFRDGSIHGCA